MRPALHTFYRALSTQLIVNLTLVANIIVKGARRVDTKDRLVLSRPLLRLAFDVRRDAESRPPG